ncbi:hypothetical protein ACN47E_007815 [Coniothyrium glycines]
MPRHNDEEYRQEVQGHIQDLLSERRPRDPHLSQVSTQRLILEGVVEAVKSYRLHKEEKVQMAKEEEQQNRQRMSDRSKRRSSKSRHRDQSRARHEDRSHRSNRDRLHEGNHGERNEGPQGRSRSRERRRHRRIREIVDPVDHSDSAGNSAYMMSGGAGPVDTRPTVDTSGHNHETLSQGSEQAQTSTTCTTSIEPVKEMGKPSSSSRRRERLGPAPVSRSPTRRKGPDGTPFGQLPHKGGGLVDHFMNTFKHIKAEQEAGHRPKGMLEKKLEGWMSKKVDSSKKTCGDDRRDQEKLHKDHFKSNQHDRPDLERVVQPKVPPRRDSKDVIRDRRTRSHHAHSPALENINTRSQSPTTCITPATALHPSQPQQSPITAQHHTPSSTQNTPPTHPTVTFIQPQGELPYGSKGSSSVVSHKEERHLPSEQDGSGVVGVRASYNDESTASQVEQVLSGHDRRSQPHLQVMRPLSTFETEGRSGSSSSIRMPIPRILMAPLPQAPLPTIPSLPSFSTPETSALPSFVCMPPQHMPVAPAPPSPPLVTPPPPESEAASRPAVGKLLHEIQQGTHLRKVPTSHHEAKRSASGSPMSLADQLSAVILNRRPQYEDTVHSHEVEERERAQVEDTGYWSDTDKPRRPFACMMNKTQDVSGDASREKASGSDADLV